eukprot:CAMPEP_0204522440 /NCGR_PEP_ID=MMETSP0661-20131031/6325_1 /ASSEMBLY_ACC=CAM_ASM_000606 /TAXON_ID=109239 /ORGANISM="Alexandrium margalefi, Strain AMGDE01CS-322" /LENGTH=62 /DNA_ID=CAMNT_0051528107 /DNA_START=44 /DNA_END=228 /DNA_ORIENTATION=-
MESGLGTCPPSAPSTYAPPLRALKRETPSRAAGGDGSTGARRSHIQQHALMHTHAPRSAAGR